MKVLLITALMLTAVTPAFAAKKLNCGKKYVEVSCKEIKDSKRDYFCWKSSKKLTTEKTEKICKLEKSKKKSKKSKKAKK